MANVGSVTDFWITAQEGFTTTTAGTVLPGASTVPLNSVAGYANGEIVALVIDPTDVTKKQVFTGIVDTTGIQITNVKWTEGTNQTHTAGAGVVDYETATAWASYSKGLKVSHNNDGTLIPSAVDSAISAGSIDTAQIADGAITGQKLSTGAILLSYTPSTTPFSTSSTTVVQVTGLSATVTIPAGGRSVRLTMWTSTMSANASTIGIMSLWRGSVGTGTQINQGNKVLGTASNDFGTVMGVDTAPPAGSVTYNVGLRSTSGQTTLGASAGMPTYLLVELI